MRRASGVAFAVLLLLASALAVLPSAVAAADPPIVRADPARAEVVAGGQFRGFLSLTSQSDFGDAFDVGGIAGSPSAVGISVSMDATNVALAPWETKKVGFLVQVPRDHPAGTHLLRFDASGTNLSSAAYLFVHVVPYRDGGLDGGLLPAVESASIGASIDSGGVFEQTIRVRNQNTTERLYPVRTRAPPGWTLTASTDGILLPVDTTEEFTVRGEPGPGAQNGTGFVEIGWPDVHTLVRVSLNLTRTNVTGPPVATPLVEVTTDEGVLPIAFDTNRTVRFYVRDVAGVGWSGEVEIATSPGFAAEGSRSVSVAPGGTTTLVLTVSSQSAIPGDVGSLTASVGASSATKDVRIEGTFLITGDRDNVELGAGQIANVEITIQNKGIYTWRGSLDFAHPAGIEVLGDPMFEIEAGASATQRFSIHALTGLEKGEVHFIVHQGRMWRVGVNGGAEDAPKLRITGDRTEVEVGDKGFVAVNVTVHNEGTTFWNGGVAVDAPSFLTVYGNETFTLPPGGSATRQFNLTLAPGAEPSEGRLAFTLPGLAWVVHVRPPADPNETSPLEVTLDRDTLALDPGQRGMVRVRVANHGSELWAGDLARDASFGLALAGDTGALVLAPGAETTVDVFVTLANGSAGTVLFEAGGAQALLRIELPVGDAGPVPIPETASLDPRVGVAVGASGIALAAGAAAAAPKRWPLAFSGLYARLAGSRLLEHPVRRKIRTLVEAAPGITYNEIGRQLDLERGVLDHHLRKLETNGLVSSVPDGQYRRFYAPGSAHPAVRGALDARILRVVRERGEARAAEVAATLGVSRQAMHYHLRRMVREGSIVANRGAGGLVLRASA